jgi:long-chain acyl-CoA synthetase
MTDSGPGEGSALVQATMGEMLATAARRFGSKPLVVATDRTLTFEQLDRLSTQFARQLQVLGIKAEDRVTLWLENGWRWMVAYYGILKLGAVVNPCNIQLTAEEIVFIVNDCGAGAIIAARGKAGGLGDRIVALVITDTTDEEISPGRSMDSLLAAAGDEQSAGALPIWSDGSGSSTIGYTSGTTGRPKGAVLRHSTILTNTAMTALMHGRTSSDIVISALPCTHVYGNVVMNAAVMCGMTLVLMPRFDEAEVLAAIQKYRATMFDGVPTMYMKMLNLPGFDGYDLSSLRLCTVGGQTMPVTKMEEVEKRFDCPLIELWGMTELGGLGTTHPHNGPRRLGSIGVALPLSEAKVVAVGDPATELPRGDVGELMMRGPLVMQGYFGNEEATRATIEPDGWMHTGDLVRQDEDGYFYVVDRAKEVIISGGYNIYPAEVERIIAQHPAVAMVAVAAMHDELKGQVPKAFIVPKVGMSCVSSEIIEHCRAHLAPYKMPREVAFLDDLPKTSTGKILRRVLATSKI